MQKTKTAALNPFIDQYELKETSFPAEVKDQEKFETNDKTISLNVMFSSSDGEEIEHG